MVYNDYDLFARLQEHNNVQIIIMSIILDTHNNITLSFVLRF